MGYGIQIFYKKPISLYFDLNFDQKGQFHLFIESFYIAVISNWIEKSFLHLSLKFFEVFVDNLLRYPFRILAKY